MGRRNNELLPHPAPGAGEGVHRRTVHDGRSEQDSAEDQPSASESRGEGLRMNASFKQIEFIKSLCAKTGYDSDNYNFATMTKEEASEIINEMLKET